MLIIKKQDHDDAKLIEKRCVTSELMWIIACKIFIIKKKNMMYINDL